MLHNRRAPKHTVCDTRELFHGNRVLRILLHIRTPTPKQGRTPTPTEGRTPKLTEGLDTKGLRSHTLR